MVTLFLIGRILLGGYFLHNAYNHLTKTKMLAGYASSKGVPTPTFAVQATGILLLIGGAGILLGMFVQYALFALIIFLVGVTPKMHAYWTVKDPMQKMSEQIQFMKNVALLGAVLMLYMIPTPWIWAFM